MRQYTEPVNPLRLMSSEIRECFMDVERELEELKKRVTLLESTKYQWIKQPGKPAEGGFPCEV